MSYYNQFLQDDRLVYTDLNLQVCTRCMVFPSLRQDNQTWQKGTQICIYKYDLPCAGNDNDITSKKVLYLLLGCPTANFGPT